jgi:hypothetical protein
VIWGLLAIAWWWLIPAVVVGMLLFIPAILLVILVGEAASWSWRRLGKRRRAGRPTVAYPYYVDESGLRALATGLKIDLPLSRQVTRSRTFTGTFRGLGGQHGRSETSVFASAIDLNRLVTEITDSVGSDKLETTLGVTPYVRDEDVLADAAAQLEESLGETSKTRELLKRLQETFETEKLESVAAAKRDELRAVADSGKLIILEGQLARHEGSNNGMPVELDLTYLAPPRWPPQVYYEVIRAGGKGEDAWIERGRIAQRRAEERRQKQPDETPMPSGVSLRLILSDLESFTSSGRERLTRTEPVYARAIAHSATYDAASGALSCYAYAVWGVPRRT